MVAMIQKEKIESLITLAKQIRIESLKSIASVGIGHIGGVLSICDTLAVLYGAVMKFDPQNPDWEERDYLVMSKGHAGPALYATLALHQFFPMEQLLTLNQPGTSLPSHCDRLKTPGIDMTTGSLGQGASSAAGIALGLQLKNMVNRVYLILGDGECNEGQVWEMALFASHHKLKNLKAFVDYNKQQIDGFTIDVMDMKDIAAKFSQFGWFAQNINGHDVVEIYEAINKANAYTEGPSVIVLNTVKGKGVSIWEENLNNHNVPITAEQLDIAIKEISMTQEC